ncbi:hypothetical protein, partial [Aquabacterium sp.]|uniref:hypothetical protein n=1 Tax=Aquabacterium sp. TaxID=1872578 RepID=UPI0025BAC317
FVVETSFPSLGAPFIIDDPPFVNPSDDHMMQRPWAIQPRLSWHRSNRCNSDSLDHYPDFVSLVNYVPIYLPRPRMDSEGE